MGGGHAVGRYSVCEINAQQVLCLRRPIKQTRKAHDGPCFTGRGLELELDSSTQSPANDFPSLIRRSMTSHLESVGLRSRMTPRTGLPLVIALASDATLRVEGWQIVELFEAISPEETRGPFVN